MEKKEKNNLRRLNSVLKKNSILIVVILFLFLACGYFYSYYMVVPKYKSTSTILLASNTLNKDSSTVTQSEVTLNKSLISTYGTILKSDNILERVISNLNLDITKDELYKNINIEEVKDTQILRINVTNQSATEAQIIAKELNNVFVEEIKEIYKMDNINIVDDASLEMVPYNINHIRDVSIFAILGIAFSALIISVIFFFDTTIKIEQDIEECSGLNVIGTIPKHRNKDGEELIVQNNSKSVISEALKTIRTNISFTKLNNGAKSILFTSCNSGEGKSWITSNIAVAYAQSNKNVIIVDADMRKGRQDKIFGVSSADGLSDCLREIEDNQDFETLEKYIKETKVPKVHLMTIGAVPPNPSELLLSSKMQDLIDMLKCIYDVVIVDGTPCNLVSDSIPVSRIVDTTLLVTESRKTKTEDLRNVIKLIENVQGKLEGVILNKKEIKKKEYGKGYYYGEIEENSKIELESHTVKELILNRRDYLDKEEKVTEKVDNEEITLLNELTEKVNVLESKLLENNAKVIEDVRKIYESEIDKNKLAKEIEENIIKNELVKRIEENKIETKNILEENKIQTQDILEKKIDELNYEDSIKGLIEKVNNIEEAVNNNNNEEKIISIITTMKEEQDKKVEQLDNSVVLNDIIDEVQELNKKYEKVNDIEKAVLGVKSESRLSKMLIQEMQEENDRKLEEIDNTDKINKMILKIKNIDDKYNKLLEEISTQDTNTNDIEIIEPIRNIDSSNSKIIELNKVKSRMKQQEMVVDCEEGVEYEQLLDLAVGVFELKPSQDHLKRKAE